MVATLPNSLEGETRTADRTSTLVEMLWPDVLVDGHEPEQRAVYHGLSWDRYLALDKALGANRAVPRLYYLDGALEIMTISREHERLKKRLGSLLDAYFTATRTTNFADGQATMRSALEKAGAEPDESWCIGQDKDIPDLVLEIVLTSGGVQKLELYQRLKVPEVWFWESGRLKIHALLPESSGYQTLAEGSRVLPRLNVALMERCMGLPDWFEALDTFRAGHTEAPAT